MNDDNEFFISLIQDHPHLYDRNNSAYKDSTKKTHSWKIIAQILKTDAPDCQHKWKLLRDRYSREKRRLLQNNGSTPNAVRPKMVEFMKQMSFLENIVVHKNPVQVVKGNESQRNQMEAAPTKDDANKGNQVETVTTTTTTTNAGTSGDYYTSLLLPTITNNLPLEEQSVQYIKIDPNDANNYMTLNYTINSAEGSMSDYTSDSIDIHKTDTEEILNSNIPQQQIPTMPTTSEINRIQIKQEDVIEKERFSERNIPTMQMPHLAKQENKTQVQSNSIKCQSNDNNISSSCSTNNKATIIRKNTQKNVPKNVDTKKGDVKCINRKRTSAPKKGKANKQAKMSPIWDSNVAKTQPSSTEHETVINKSHLIKPPTVSKASNNICEDSASIQVGNQNSQQEVMSTNVSGTQDLSVKRKEPPEGIIQLVPMWQNLKPSGLRIEGNNYIMNQPVETLYNVNGIEKNVIVGGNQQQQQQQQQQRPENVEQNASRIVQFNSHRKVIGNEDFVQISMIEQTLQSGDNRNYVVPDPIDNSIGSPYITENVSLGNNQQLNIRNSDFTDMVESNVSHVNNGSKKGRDDFVQVVSMWDNIKQAQQKDNRSCIENQTVASTANNNFRDNKIMADTNNSQQEKDELNVTGVNKRSRDIEDEEFLRVVSMWQNIKQKKREAENSGCLEDELFALSVVESLSKFPPRKKNCIKGEIMLLLSKVETTEIP